MVGNWNPRQSHHAYLDIWLDLGLVGLGTILYVVPWTLYKRWPAIKGLPGTRQRRAMAAIYACSISYLTVYALAQSYFLRFDHYTFMTMCWCILVIGNPDQTRIENEIAPA